MSKGGNFAKTFSEGKEFYDDGYDSDVESICNRLDFSNIKFYGRKEELRLLLSHYVKDCCNEQEEIESHRTQVTPIILIDGYSGSGKSKLVETFAHEVIEKSKIKTSDGLEGSIKPCLFLSGKFDGRQSGNPFSAIIEAISGYTSVLIHGDVKRLKVVRESIRNEMRPEAIQTLISVFPDLTDISCDAVETAAKKVDNNSFIEQCRSTREVSENILNRLKYAFHSLLRVICSENQPVILFLDDLQWVDIASLQLVTAVLEDPSPLPNFMFIGCFRSNDVHIKHPLSLSLGELEDKITRQKNKKVKKIHLPNLSMEDIGEFISDLLFLEYDDVLPLTKVIFDKTRGNIFFAKQMLEEFEYKNVLFYSIISFSWEWNLTAIQKILSETASFSADFYNSIDIVMKNIQNAPKIMQTVLTVATYIRSTFDVDTLQILMEAVGCPIDNRKELIKILDEAVLLGMLTNKVSSNEYRFAHDKIYEAAQLLDVVIIGGISDSSEAVTLTQDELREKIGKRLFIIACTACEGNKADVNFMFYVAADHINSIKIQPSDENKHNVCPLFLTKLNLEAGEKASDVAGFVSASNYLRKSLQALKKNSNHWTSHYDLSLRVYRAVSAIELLLGNFKVGNDYGRELLKYAICTCDKVSTYMSLGLALGRQSKRADALNLNWEALQLLGAKRNFSFRIPSFLKDLAIVRLFFKTHSDDEILGLPKMTNERIISTMKFYDGVFLNAQCSGNLLDTAISFVRRLRLTFEHGICESTVLAIVHYSVFVGKSGDQRFALRLSNIALQMIDKISTATATGSLSDYTRSARALFCIAHFVEGWSQPPAETLQRFQESEKYARGTGDIGAICTASILSFHFQYMVGRPLDTIEKTGMDLGNRLEQYKLNTQMSLFREMRLPIIYLTGSANAPLNWNKLDAFGPSVTEDPSDLYILMYGYLTRLALSVYFFRTNKFALGWIHELKRVTKHDSAAAPALLRLFYSGLIFSSLARETGLQEYRSQSKKELKEMERLTKVRWVKNNHRCMLMKAHLIASKKNRHDKEVEKVKQLYRSAIHTAIENGCVHDAALGLELAAEYVSSIGERELYRKYLSDACNLYRQWGAIGKVEQLEKNDRTFVDESTTVLSSARSTSHSSLSSKVFLSIVALALRPKAIR